MGKFIAPLDATVAKWVAGLSPDLREHWQERAGIMEFEGGLDRRTAEMEAMKSLALHVVAKANYAKPK